MGRTSVGRSRPHSDPAPFDIKTSVGWRTIKVCTLCGALVLAEPGGHERLDGELQHMIHHNETNTLGSGRND